jgi:hypothetical protein
VDISGARVMRGYDIGEVTCSPGRMLRRSGRRGLLTRIPMDRATTSSSDPDPTIAWQDDR